MKAPAKLTQQWLTDLGDRASTPVVAAGKLFVAVINQGRVCALNAQTGRILWNFVAGGRIDTPPTIHGPLCLFGAHDGWVYCLRADDGALVWRGLCAPEHRRIVAYDRVESPWPVMGSVLVHRDVAYALAGRLTRVDGGMYLAALDPWTGNPLWRQHLTGFQGEKAQVLPQSWHIHEEHMTNNLLLGKSDSIRLDDEFGTWQFSTKDGRIEGRSSEIPQPGWPKGRKTPKNEVAAERWPWCGWDRVTSAELLAGKDTYAVMAPGMHPFTRAVPKYQACLFPDAKNWGIHGMRLNRENQFQLEPASFHDRDLPREKMPWPPRVVDLDVKAYLFAGNILLVGGGTPVAPRQTGGQVRAISMTDGKDLAVADLPTGVNFDGLAAAYGRIYAALTDGKVCCLSV